MRNNLNEKKFIQDVAKISDKAAQLLGEFGEKSVERTLVQRTTKQRRGNYESNNSVSENIQSSRNNSAVVEFMMLLSVGSISLAFLVMFFAKELINQPSSSSKVLISDLLQSHKKQMNSDQKRFYRQTLIEANDAVLIKEHKEAIENLKTLKNGQYKTLVDVDKGLINDKIIQASKKIGYLDQPGNDEYWEGQLYGYQWYDEHPDKNFKVFFTFSRSCSNPVVVFGYRPKNSNRNQPPVKTIRLIPRSYVSTMLVPYFGENSLWIDRFQCN